MPKSSLKRNDLLLLIAFVILLLLVGVVGYYIVSSSNKPKSVENDNVNLEPMVSQEETDASENYITTFEPFTLEMTKGKFEKAQDRRIFIKDGDNTVEFPLNNEIALICTQRDLDEITELKYESSELNINSPDVVGDIVIAGESIVVFTQEVSGIPTAHTIFVSSKSCPE